jgi:UDP-N-acetylglucosamine 1-carboxyvinyltransferase
MLIAMGADISGVGSNLLVVNGVKTLNGCNHTVLPDMIEIGSWIGLAVMTKSQITIKNVSWDNLGQIPNVFRKLGIKLEKRDDDIFIDEHKDGYEIQNYIDGSVLTVSDAPWPGFTPDLLSIILVVATQARGSVLIHQKMFESRLFFVDKLIDMGAKIILCDPHRATVIGHDFTSQLKATTMVSPDIRAGISLLIAALSANGKSLIHNIEQIDRGYENIDERLRALGAKIQRI